MSPGAEPAPGEHLRSNLLLASFSLQQSHCLTPPWDTAEVQDALEWMNGTEIHSTCSINEPAP